MNCSSLNLHQGSATAFVPIVSASVAMQMPQVRAPIYSQPRSWSTPSTPALYEFHPPSNYGNQINGSHPPSSSSLASLSNASASFSAANSSSSNLRNLRNDLLIAADSVTNAMQNLVKELNSENESYNDSTDEEVDNRRLVFRNENATHSGTNGAFSSVQFSSKNNPYFTQPIMIQTGHRMNTEGTEPKREAPIRRKKKRNGPHNESLIIDADKDDENFDEDDGYNEEEEEDDDELDYEDDNCLMTESFIDDLNAANAYGLVYGEDKTAGLQQMHLHQAQLMANLAAGNEQVASWRRELEQRLIDDAASDSPNSNEKQDSTDDKKQ